MRCGERGREALGQVKLKAKVRMNKQVPWGRIRRQSYREQREWLAGSRTALSYETFHSRAGLLSAGVLLPLSVIIILSLKT